MKSFGKTLPALLFVSGAFFAAQQAAAATASSNATATVVTPISISNSKGLSFGTVAPGASAGTVVIDTAGGRSATGGITLVPVELGSAATFDVNGEPDYSYTITLPTSITLTGAGSSMTVDSFTSDPGGTGTLDNSGGQTLGVGATLHVNPSQPAGDYSGTFEVTVEYN